MNDLEEKVSRIDENVTTLKECVMGPSDDHSDEGMSGDVNKNTHFRKVIFWILSIIASASITGFIYALVRGTKIIIGGQ